MNILMLTPDYYPNNYGGIGIHVYELSHKLADLGNKVTVINVRMDYFLSNEYSYIHDGLLTVISFESKGKMGFHHSDIYSYRSNYNSITIMDSLFSELKDDFDIIHVHDHYCALLFDVLKQVYPKAHLVTSIHSCKADSMFFEDSIRRFVSFSTNAVIANSQFIKQQLINKYGINERSITVAECGVNWPERIIKETPQYISYLGRISIDKGVDTLINGYNNLHQKNHKIPPLFIAGEGDFTTGAKQLVRELNLEAVIHFCGHIDHSHINEFMSKSYIHILPSKYEAYGLSAIEAMSYGVPVIASNVGGLKKIIKDYENGLLFTVGDYSQLSEKMRLLLTDDALRNRISTQAREDSKHMSSNDMVEIVMSVYKSIKDAPLVQRNSRI